MLFWYSIYSKFSRIRESTSNLINLIVLPIRVIYACQLTRKGFLHNQASKWARATRATATCRIEKNAGIAYTCAMWLQERMNDRCRDNAGWPTLVLGLGSKATQGRPTKHTGVYPSIPSNPFSFSEVVPELHDIAHGENPSLTDRNRRVQPGTLRMR